MQQAATKRWTGAPLDTPYRRARQEWDRRMGTAVVQARNWRLAFFGVLGLFVLALGGMLWLGLQPKAVPHIVEIDKIGAVAYVGPVGKGAAEYKPTQASIEYHLRRFIEDTRSISSDEAVLKRNWIDAYKLVTAAAGNQLTAYVEESDPFKRALSQRVSLDVTSVVPLSSETWQVDWTETIWEPNGMPGPTSTWRGTFRIEIHPPESAEAMAANPIGLFIQEFHWSRLQS